jgi:hypothetical protein
LASQNCTKEFQNEQSPKSKGLNQNRGSENKNILERIKPRKQGAQSKPQKHKQNVPEGTKPKKQGA